MVQTLAFKALALAAVGFIVVTAAIGAGVGMIDEGEKWLVKLGGEKYLWEHHRALCVMGVLRVLCAVVALVALAVTAIAWAVGA